MTHARQQIRDLVIQQLKQDLPSYIAVLDNRVWNIQQNELPAVAVYSSTESIDGEQNTFSDNLILYRELNVITEIRVQESDGSLAEISLNNIAELIEVSLSDSRQSLGLIELVPDNWDSSLDNSGEQVTGSGVLSWLAMYRTEIGIPNTLI